MRDDDLIFLDDDGVPFEYGAGDISYLLDSACNIKNLVDYFDFCSFARELGADDNATKMNVVLSSGNPYAIKFFAQLTENANLDVLQKAMAGTNNIQAISGFIKDVKGNSLFEMLDEKTKQEVSNLMSQENANKETKKNDDRVM